MKNFTMLIAALFAVWGSVAASSDTCIQAECEVTGFGANQRALWLPNLPGGIHQDFRFDENGGLFEVFPDGTARVTGTCYNMQNPNLGFVMDFNFTQRSDWATWSALSRSWKGNASIVGNNFLEWDFYILDDSKENTLTGLGGLEGSLLTITHMPVDYFYGLQVGIAANDKNGAQGMSFWFYHSGILNGAAVSGHGDINLEGGCQEVPVFDCPVDITVSCDAGSFEPLVTGFPEINCQESYEVTYTDEVSGTDCLQTILRTWSVTNQVGETLTCIQTINVVDDTPPVIAPLPQILESCDFEAIAGNFISDNCTNELSISVEVLAAQEVGSEPCDPGQLRTQTIGGWGASANGNNPGAYRDANFSAAFPNGLTIGCNNTLTLTSSAALQAFLPSGGPSAILPVGSLVDPTSLPNTLASQLIGITLSLGFDAYDPDFGASDFALADVVYAEGTFAGMTLTEVVQIANEVIGGCSTAYTLGQLNTALTTANQNYVDGTQNNGAFICNSLELECALGVTLLITATDACGNTSTSEQVVYLQEDQQAFTLPSQNITVSCGDIPEPDFTFDLGCFEGVIQIEVEETEFSGACQATIQRTFTLTGICGFSASFVQYITVIDDTPPVFLTTPEDVVLGCDEAIPAFEPEASDNCGVSELLFTEAVENMACGRLITQSWTAADLCGNTTTVTRQIFVNYDTAPVAVNEPLDLTVGCGAVPQPEPMEFVSGCGAPIQVVLNETSEGEGCSQIVTRTWIATDDCGNQTEVVQIITVTDDEPPVFLFVPEDAVLSCCTEPVFPKPQAVDNCSGVTVTTVESFDESADACGVLIRTFTAMDACGNVSVATQTVTFIDNEPPVLYGAPQTAAFSCNELSATYNVTAVDNCTENVEVTFEEEISNDDCVISVLRTWTATDNCGNTTLATQAFSFMDMETPQITGNTEVFVECANLEIASQVQVTDDCEAGLTLTHSDQILEGSACDYTIERTYTATDLCGNTATFVQLIHVVDETGPVFVQAPQNVTIGCGSPLPEPVFTVQDNCSEVSVSVSEETIGSGCSYQVVRTFTATDDCGNIATADQVINVVDQTAPVFTFVPENLEIGCGQLFPQVVEAAAEDNCSEVSMQFTEMFEESACGGTSLIRVWRAFDACGNQSIATQTITQVDQEAPVFGPMPADIEAECGAVPEPAEVVAFDNCSEVTITFNQTTSSGGCPNIFRTWVATDACGNSVSHTQTIFVDDTEPPVISGIPPNTTASCNALPPLPDPDVSDNCDDEVDVALVETVVGSGCFFTIIRTWIATDNCGNTAVVSQSITVEDTEAPVFVNVPPFQTVDCSVLDAMPLPNVTDDCGDNITVTFEDVIEGDGCSYNIHRTYTAMDLCGNTAQASTVIQVEDQTPPTIFGVGPNTMVQCGQIPDPNNAYAVDQCGGEAALEVSDTIIGEGCSYIINRSYTATDECGNAMTITQLIYVSDTSAPVLLGVPDNLVLDCDGQVPPAPQVGAIDHCDGVVPVSFNEFTEFNGCAEVVTRVWSAVDQCGNVATATRSVSITDITPPTFTLLPEDRTVTCSEVPDFETAQAIDNCGEVSISIDEVVVTGDCPFEIHRTYTATDECGNSSQHVQVLSVIDNEAPVIEGDFSDLTVGCGSLPEPQEVNVFDNCGDVELIFTETFGPACCSQLLERRWTAIDNCGNETTVVRMIIVEDETAPVFENVPENLTVNCLQVPDFVDLTAWDDCGIVNQSMNEHVVEGQCASEYTLIRTWVASDACGNQTVAVQEINVIDDIAPLLSNLPVDLTVNCDEVPEPAEVTVVESCGESVELFFTEEIIELSSGVENCAVGNAAGFTGDLALWLPGIDGVGEHYVFGPEGGSFSENPETGTAVLRGVVFNKDNSNLSWYLEVQLHEARDWEAWSALERSYKDDLGVAAEHYTNWTYYILNGASSRLTGLGVLEGSELTLSHAPMDSLYGFQLGMNANNHGLGTGMGGWFYYSGVFNGQAVTGQGDVFTLQSCCPEQQIIRTWTAVDCAGNTSSHVQHIHVVPGWGNEPIELRFQEGATATEFDVRGSTGDEFIVEVKPDFTGRARIDIYDGFGRLIDTLHQFDAIEGVVCNFRFPKAGLDNGMYYFILSADGRMATDRELVAR